MDKSAEFPDPKAPGTNAPGSEEEVWRYRGYRMRPAELNTALVHLYRGEITRSNIWRTRLDTTTNWAVVTTGAALSFALTNPQSHYTILILDTLLITLFWWIEARRYRYYELWSYRTRLLETDFFARLLTAPYQPDPGWAEALAGSLRQPAFPISLWEALGRRLRRNYIWIYLILDVAWILKTYLYPVAATGWQDFVDRTALGTISGYIMVGLGIAFNLALLAFALFTARLRQSPGEIFTASNNAPRYYD